MDVRVKVLRRFQKEKEAGEGKGKGKGGEGATLPEGSRAGGNREE